MCKTHKFADQLEVKLLKQLKGAAVLDIPQSGPLEDGSYLVEDGAGQKMVLKTGNFNPHETDDNWELSDMGVRVRMISESQPDEYILYEYLDAPLLASQQFWQPEQMQRVFDLHRQIAAGLAHRPQSAEEAANAKKWVEERVLGEWLVKITDNPYTPEEAEQIRQVLESAQAEWEPVWAYTDNNAEHYVDMGTELAVVDARIDMRPPHYMDMRYLAWVILQMPSEELSLEWVQGWVAKLGAERQRLVTFLISLVGIMWDIYGNEKHGGRNKEKTEMIREITKWVLERLDDKWPSDQVGSRKLFLGD